MSLMSVRENRYVYKLPICLKEKTQNNLSRIARNRFTRDNYLSTD